VDTLEVVVGRFEVVLAPRGGRFLSHPDGGYHRALLGDGFPAKIWEGDGLLPGIEGLQMSLGDEGR